MNGSCIEERGLRLFPLAPLHEADLLQSFSGLAFSSSSSLLSLFADFFCFVMLRSVGGTDVCACVVGEWVSCQDSGRMPSFDLPAFEGEGEGEVDG